jgi:hypothetical protein
MNGREFLKTTADATVSLEDSNSIAKLGFEDEHVGSRLGMS